MKCDVEKLSALADGDLGPGEAARVRGHLAGCAACRAALDTIEALKRTLADEGARELGRAPDAFEAVWAKLKAPERRPWWRPLRARFALALSPVAMAAAVAAMLWLRGAPGPTDDQLLAQAAAEFRRADAQYARALEKLRTVAQRARAEWPEVRRREFDEAQAALEAATEKCRLAARARPADPDAEALLFAAYRRQIGFFQEQLLRAEAAR